MGKSFNLFNDCDYLVIIEVLFNILKYLIDSQEDI